MINYFKKIFPQIFRKRGFKAATINRLSNDWAYTILTVNDDIKRNYKVMVMRSRELAKNNNYYRKYLSMCERNIIGPNGITLQMKCADLTGRLDKQANDIIETKWSDWGHRKYCEMSGKLSWIDLKKLFVRTLKTDGEVIIRIHKGMADNPYMFSLQMIDNLALDVDYNVDLPNGNRIIMGVELDTYFRPIAYHFRISKGETTYYQKRGFERQRIPADEIIHCFKPEFPGQVRGYPVSCSAMLSMNMLNGYSEAELVAARIASSKMGFYEEDSSTGSGMADDKSSDQLLSEVAPGKFERLPPGFKFHQFDPTHPNGNYAGFVQAQLREIAGGVDVSYNSLASDLSSVNFSSMRSGALEERDAWKMDQRLVIESLCDPVFYEWLVMGLTTQAVPLPLAKLNKFNAATWQPRAWQWVDPRADAEANLKLLENNLKTPQQIVGEMGGDLEDIYAAIQKAQELKKKYQISTGEENDISENGETANASKDLKDVLESYGIGVRAGVITPQMEDENTIRNVLNLPAATGVIKDAWKSDGGTRRPITLKSQDEIKIQEKAAEQKLINDEKNKDEKE